MHDKKVSGSRNIHGKVRNALINIGIRLKQRYKFILKKEERKIYWVYTIQKICNKYIKFNKH
jgi:hypothetical protein